jgi:hypothetical protein
VCAPFCVVREKCGDLGVSESVYGFTEAHICWSFRIFSHTSAPSSTGTSAVNRQRRSARYFALRLPVGFRSRSCREARHVGLLFDFCSVKKRVLTNRGHVGSSSVCAAHLPGPGRNWNCARRSQRPLRADDGSLHHQVSRERERASLSLPAVGHMPVCTQKDACNAVQDSIQAEIALRDDCFAMAGHPSRPD